MMLNSSSLKGLGHRSPSAVLPARERRRIVKARQANDEQAVAPAPADQQQQYQGLPDASFQPYGYPPAVNAAPVAAPDSSAVYAPPPGYPQPYQQRMGQEYYMVPPPGYYAPPPVYKTESSGLPWWVFLGIGAAVGVAGVKIQEFAKNPQAAMTQMAMKAMMNNMGQPGGAAGGMPPPFGKPGSMPPGFPPGFPAGFPSSPAASSATVDVPVSAPSSSAAAAGENGSSFSSSSQQRKGDKFSSRLNGEGRAGSLSTTASTNGTTTTSTNGSTDAAKDGPSSSSGYDVVEPIVKEPPSSKSSSKRSSSFFADAAAQSNGKADTSSSSSSSSSSSASNTSSSSTSGSDATAGQGSVMSAMMENMLRNPEMQKMLYPYLPEGMRNPQSIEWMLSNPEVKQQMAAMFEQQNVMSPQMLEMMKGMDFNQDKVNQQFQELGLKPEDVISKVMANPELAAGFSNPRVQSAIMDISQNPMNIMKYQSDPEVMKVLEQVTTLFQPDVAPNQRN